MPNGFRNSLLCDDIRQEKNNKYIIVGVFSGDVVVSQLPATLVLRLYSEFVSDDPGQHELAIRFVVSGEQKAEVKARIELPRPGTATLTLPPIPIELSGEGELQVLAVLDGEEPVELVQKRVVRGEVTT